MSRLKAFFTHKWTLGIIGLTALSLLIWFGAEYIKFGENNATLPHSVRASIIGTLVLVWLTWNICLWLMERRNNTQLLDNLEQDEGLSPDEERSQEEQQLIQERFKDAIDVLKKSRFKSYGGSKSLYQLPWYVIIGPPGAGKTTALVNSGLEFPLANSHGKEALGGIGGTRNCDWWFTNDAVMIDTAGRYTTQDSHRVVDNKAWSKFIEMLKRYRTRRPINGAILAVSLQDLMVQTAEQRVHLAKTLRQRINELQQQLGIRFPIYVTFTKCDLVAGFSEFFSNMSHAEREQVWGVTFPPQENDAQGVDLDSFSPQFDQLVERLNERLLWRIHQERNLEKRSNLQGFPARFESLNTILEDFIRQTFSANRFDNPPLLRGVYFTSATQEGCPIDRMMASVSATFGLERDMGRQQTSTGKSFFLGRLLRDVIFPESELVGVNRKIESSMIWLRRGAFISLSVVVIACLTLWTGSVTRNKMYMSEVEDNLQQFVATQDMLDNNNRDLLKTLPALNPLKISSEVYDRDNNPWLTGVGLYDGSVDSAAKSLYADKLKSVYLPSFARNLESRLSRMSAKDPALLATLKVYLMLGDQSKRNNEEILAFAKHEWEQDLRGKASEQQQLLDHLYNALNDPHISIEPNQRIVDRARQQLRRTPVSQRLYAQLQNENGDSFDLYNQMGSDAETVFVPPQDNKAMEIPTLFTKQTYDQIDFGADSPLLLSFSENQWIYGGNTQGEDFSETDRERLGNDIKRLYLSEYTAQWQALLKNLELQPFRSSSEALEKLNLLSDPVYSPLLAIAEVTAENTSLTPRIDTDIDSSGLRIPVSSTARRVASAAGSLASDQLSSHYQPTAVDMRFEDLQRLVKSEKNRPAKIQDYLNAIAEIHEYIAELDSSANSNEAAFEAAKLRFNGNRNNPIQKLRTKANNAPEPFSNWLDKIASNTWSLVLAKSKNHLDSVWQDQVYGSYSHNLSNRYPIVASRSAEAPMDDFNNYFKPGGIEQTFVAENIAPFLDIRRWKIKRLDGQGLDISASTINQLKRAENIRRAFFSTGSNAKIAFKIEPAKLDSSVRMFSLEIGDVRVPYSHGPRTTSNLNWTGGEDIRARVIFEDLNETVHRKHFEGDWAWFRLLDESDVQPSGNNTYKVTFEEEGRQAQFKLMANSSINPFNNGLLSSYRCPKTL